MSSFSNRKTFVISLPRKTHITLLNVAAKRNVDVEQIIEDAIELQFSRDNKLDRQRDADNRAREDAERRQRLGLTNTIAEPEDHRLPIHDEDTEAEIARLLRLAKP